jgi:predicted lipase
LEFALTDINATNFPNAPSKWIRHIIKILLTKLAGGVQVHDGFQATFERTSDTILSTVTSALQKNSANQVTVVGHSLGAAIAVMDAVFLSGALNSTIQMTTTVFGLPRGGNQDWANFVDSTVSNCNFFSLYFVLIFKLAW